jgi:hypothetical protein
VQKPLTGQDGTFRFQGKHDSLLVRLGVIGSLRPELASATFVSPKVSTRKPAFCAGKNLGGNGV